ncbi:MAG: L,D-transpeptidase [Clostridia bacterium]|nr:L,D-transpeptidase [Clostridia bacterium]
MKFFKKAAFILLAALTALMPLVFCACHENVPDPDDIEAVDITENVQQTAAPTAVPTKEPDPTPEPTPTPVVDLDPEHPYYLYVEKGSYTLTIYGKDENYNYTVIVKQYRIGHGGNKTPIGLFTLSETRYRWYDFRLGGSVQYATSYWGNLFIHSPLYGAQDPSRIWPRYYNGEMGIGTSNTGGCLRMVTEAAKFIYFNCPPGTKLEIVNGSPRGTTSPDVPEITRKGYDPTDVDALKGDD